MEVVLNRYVKAVLAALIIGFVSNDASSADYDDEILREVLKNANLRAEPRESSESLAVIPGGFVVSIAEPTKSESDWYQVNGAAGDYPNGYIHKSLLAPTSFSYQTAEFSNTYHRIKYFSVDWYGNTYVHPQSHARIYSKDGSFLSHFPRLLDTAFVSGAVYVLPRQLENDFPYYELLYYTGGNHCCFRSIFLAKSPLFETELVADKGLRSYEVFDASGNGDWRLRTFDLTYTLWLYSWASSPMPEVIFEISDGTLVVSYKSMKAEPPTDQEMRKLIARQPSMREDFSDSEWDTALGSLTGNMVWLIYSGNAEAAFSLLNSVWPDGVRFSWADSRLYSVWPDGGTIFTEAEDQYDRESFKEELVAMVRSSPFFEGWMLPQNRME
jgi:hypothetical protein